VIRIPQADGNFRHSSLIVSALLESFHQAQQEIHVPVWSITAKHPDDDGHHHHNYSDHEQSLRVLNGVEDHNQHGLWQLIVTGIFREALRGGESE
jgi:hypothetical protein